MVIYIRIVDTVINSGVLKLGKKYNEAYNEEAGLDLLIVLHIFQKFSSFRGLRN